MIEVRLFATFREGRGKIAFLDENQFHIGSQVLDYFKISYDEVSIFLINGRHSEIYAPIKDGDILAIFPPVGGG